MSFFCEKRGAAAGVALLAHLNYYDILLHGGKGAGQLDGILHQAVQLLVYGRDAPLADKCHLEHIRHCPACRHRQYGAGQHCSHRHLQSALAHTAGNELRQCHPDDDADIITGVSLFLLFVSFGISQGFTTVVLAHITFCTPYVVLSVMPRLKKMNQNVYEAALDLGATPFQALRKVILPEIFPGMISGFILAFTLSIDDFAVTIFTIGNQGLETLSTYIYADARKGGLTPELRPLSTIIFVTVLVLLIVINKRAERTKND